MAQHNNSERSSMTPSANPSSDARKAGAPSAPEANDEQAKTSVGESFSAWRQSRAHGKELKARRRERQNLGEQIDDAQETLDDHNYILSNFDAEMGKQRTIYQNAEEAAKKEQRTLDKLGQDIKDTQKELDAMIKDHEGVAKGYREAKDKAQDELDRITKKANQLQSEVNKVQRAITGAEKDIASLSVTADTSDDAGAIDKARSNIANLQSKLAEDRSSLGSLQSQLGSANAEKGSAQASADGANRAYKEITRKHEDEEKKLRRSIKSMQDDAAETQQRLGDQQNKMKAATERMNYVQQVHDNPDSTTNLASSLAGENQRARQMDAEIAAMEETHKRLKKRSHKAMGVSAAIVLGIIVILVIILLFVFVYEP